MQLADYLTDGLIDWLGEMHDDPDVIDAGIGPYVRVNASHPDGIEVASGDGEQTVLIRVEEVR